MARLIEIQDLEKWRSPQTIHVGDVLLFRAAGGHVRSGEDVVEILGPFVTAVVGDAGDILTPMGPPNIVLFRARQTGEAEIDLIKGDPFHAPKMTLLRITVES